MSINRPDWLKCSGCAWYEGMKDVAPKPWWDGHCHLRPGGIAVTCDWWCREWTLPAIVKFAGKEEDTRIRLFPTEEEGGGG